MSALSARPVSAVVAASLVAACAHHPAAAASASAACSQKVLVVSSQLRTPFEVFWLAPGAEPTAPLNQGRFLLGRASLGVTRFNIPTADGAGQPLLGVQHVGPFNPADASATVECRQP